MGEALSAQPPIVVGRSEDTGVSGEKEECVGATEEGGCATEALVLFLRKNVLPWTRNTYT